MNCYKIKYGNFGKALKAIQKINRQPGYDLKRAYQCPYCGFWHTTSEEMRK
jgi:hypothetical protein